MRRPLSRLRLESFNGRQPARESQWKAMEPVAALPWPLYKGQRLTPQPVLQEAEPSPVSSTARDCRRMKSESQELFSWA